MGRRSGDSKTKTHIQDATHKQEGIRNFRGSPKKQWVTAPHWAPHAHWAFPALERWSPRIFDFEAQQPCIQEDRKAVGSRLPLFNGACTILYIPHPSTEVVIWKRLSDSRAELGDTPPTQRRREATGAHPRVINTLTQFTAVLREFILAQGHWCWQAPYWSPPSSLLTLEAHPLTSRPARVLGHPGTHSQHCGPRSTPAVDRHQPSTPGPQSPAPRLGLSHQ